MADKQLLIDNFGTFKPTLVEDKRAQGGKYIVRGEFARAGVATENKRMYPRDLWEREFNRMKKAMSERKVYGMQDHPADGRTSLSKASHLVTSLHLEGEIVIGEAEILNTYEGKNLKAIIEGGGSVGVSSRGFGTTRPNQEGIDIVQADYRLASFDFVADPANVTSYPTVHAEDRADDAPPVVENKPEVKLGKRLPVSETFMSDKMTLEKLKEANKGLYESLRDEAEREFEKRGAAIWAKKIEAARDAAAQDLRPAFAENLKAALEDAKSEIAQQERDKLLNDPTVAGAKSALDQLKSILRPYIVPEDVETIVANKEKEVTAWQTKLADAELKIANLTKENASLADIAKEAGYKYHLESMLQGNPLAATVRKMVGDVKLFENVEALNYKVSEVADELAKVNQKQEERDLEIERLNRENLALREASEKALEAAALIGVMNYAETRLANHPKRDIARQLIEAKAPTSKEQVNVILDSLREKKIDPRALDEARARVRKMVGSSTKEYIKENEENPRQIAESTGGSDYNQLGQSVDMLRALSGIGTDN